MTSTVFRRLLSRADAFFFGPDTTRWDLVRWGSAFIVLAVLLLAGASGSYERFYGHHGSLPRAEAIDIVQWPAFLFLMKSDPAWIWRIYWATIASAVCLALGLWTRVAAAVTFFLYVAMIQRNGISFAGESGLLPFMLVALVFAPAPDRFSLDHRVLKKPLPARTELWPARFVQFNVCMIYFFTTVAKLTGTWDLGRGEIWYQITLSDWFRFPELEWLRARWICWLAVHGSLLVEGSFAFLVWTRLRVPMVLLLISLHAAIIFLFLNALLFFNVAAMTALCGFLREGDLNFLKSLAPGTRRARKTEPVRSAEGRRAEPRAGATTPV